MLVLASVSVWDQHLESRGLAPVYTMNVLNYDSISDVLLPRAAGYAAGLLEHFFAGRIDARVQPAADTAPTATVAAPPADAAATAAPAHRARRVSFVVAAATGGQRASPTKSQ